MLEDFDLINSYIVQHWLLLTFFYWHCNQEQRQKGILNQQNDAATHFFDLSRIFSTQSWWMISLLPKPTAILCFWQVYHIASQFEMFWSKHHFINLLLVVLAWYPHSLSFRTFLCVGNLGHFVAGNCCVVNWQGSFY